MSDDKYKWEPVLDDRRCAGGDGDIIKPDPDEGVVLPPKPKFAQPRLQVEYVIAQIKDMTDEQRNEVIRALLDHNDEQESWFYATIFGAPLKKNPLRVVKK